MIPDGTAVERVGSALVDTFTSPDTCATPMVKPESVIVTASLIVEAPRVIVKVAACVLGVDNVKYIPNRMTRLRVTFILIMQLSAIYVSSPSFERQCAAVTEYVQVTGPEDNLIDLSDLSILQPYVVRAAAGAGRSAVTCNYCQQTQVHSTRVNQSIPGTSQFFGTLKSLLGLSVRATDKSEVYFTRKILI